jgi:DNA-binding transcriptional LysR family regulator
MEFNDLRIFRTVARLESITKAANELGYVQPNISERIKVLENELGVSLFKRTNKGVRLLRAGEVLLIYSVKIMNILDDLKRNITSENELYKIATTQSIAKTYIEEKLVKFNSYCSLYIEQNRSLEVLLKSGDVDIIVTHSTIINPLFKRVGGYQETVLLFKEKNKKITALSEETFFINRDKSCPFRQISLAFANKHDIKTSQLLEIDSYEMIKSMILAQRGIAFLPARTHTENLSTVPLEDTNRIKINFYIRQDSHKIVPDFLIKQAEILK